MILYCHTLSNIKTLTYLKLICALYMIKIRVRLPGTYMKSEALTKVLHPIRHAELTKLSPELVTQRFGYERAN